MRFSHGSPVIPSGATAVVHSAYRAESLVSALVAMTRPRAQWSRLAVLPAIAFTLALAGCVGSISTPITSPSATSPAAPSPAATAPPVPEPVTAQVVVLSDSITVVNSAGTVIDTVDYFTAPVETIQVLTDAFGFSPNTVLSEPCNCDRPFNATYTWDGFQLFATTDANDAPGELQGEPPYYTVTSVRVTAASVRGVAVSTADDVAVGDSVDGFAARYFAVTEPNYQSPDQPDQTVFNLGVVAVPDDGYGTNLSFSVHVRSVVQEDIVTSIVTPIQNGFGL